MLSFTTRRQPFHGAPGALTYSAAALETSGRGDGRADLRETWMSSSTPLGHLPAPLQLKLYCAAANGSLVIPPGWRIDLPIGCGWRMNGVPSTGSCCCPVGIHCIQRCVLRAAL